VIVRQLLIGSLLVVVSIIAVACAARSEAVGEPSSSGASPKYSVEVARGAELYVSYACVQCHGLSGRGRKLIPTSGPSLVSADFKKAFPRQPDVDATLVQMIRNGAILEGNRAASMPAWNGILTDDGMANIVAYIRSGLPDLQIPISKASTGEEAFRAFACVKCHGELGKGGNINQAAATSEHRIIPTLGGESFRKRLGSKGEVRKVLLHGRLVEGGRLGVVYMPAWGRIGTADQIEQLANYIWSFDGE
jgi:cbb3-type cytochrome c oxidase subunit III